MIKELIESNIQKYYEKSSVVYPHNSNWCSQVGHPCERFLYYQRVAWADMKPLPIEIKPRLEVGNAIEALEKQTWRNAGIQVYESAESIIDKDLELSGKLDFEIQIDKQIIPCEVKSISDNFIGKFNTANDFLKAKWYYKQYMAQLGLYLYIKNKEKGLLILRSFKERKIIEIELFGEILDYITGIIEKIKRVNIATMLMQEPDRTDDDSICESCNARHICCPDINIQNGEISLDNELEELLIERDNLKENSKRYEEINDIIKLKVKEKPRLQVGNYLIEGKWVERKESIMQASKYWGYKIKKII